MSLQEILAFRRATRKFSDQPISAERVRQCLQLATLAPTSNNMQLYEMVHVTDKGLLQRLATACLDQVGAQTAQQMVVFVTRHDHYRQRVKQLIAFERENISRHSAPADQERRIKEKETYYGKMIPFLYSRFFGLWGALRKAMLVGVGAFRPMFRQCSETDTRIVLHKSCALVAQTFMLAMAEAGYDTCPLEGFDSLRIKHLLHLPCSAEVTMVVACGKRDAEGIHGDRFRVDFNEVYSHRG